MVPKQTHDGNINTLELFMEWVHAGAPVLVQRGTAVGQHGSLLQRALPRLLRHGSGAFGRNKFVHNSFRTLEQDGAFLNWQ